MRFPSICFAVVLAIPCTLSAQPPLRISHGPILGHITSTTAAVWSRTNRPGSFQVRFGTEPNRLDKLSKLTQTALDHDNTGWVILEGLTPDTRYFYRPVTQTDQGPAGSFRTIPAASQYVDPETNPKGLFNFRFQFGSCADQRPQNGRDPGLPGYATMLRQLDDKVLFSIMNGDWLYEDKRDHPVSSWRDQVGLGNGPLPAVVESNPSIVGVWENYKTFLERGANLAAWHRMVPSYFTTDDHELLNDIYGTADIGRRDRATVFRDIGLQAWFDYLAGSQPMATNQGIFFGKAKLTAGSDILEDPTADFTKLDLSKANNLHVHWGGQFAGVDVGRGSREPGDANSAVYGVVEVLGKTKLKIRPAAKETRESTYSVGRGNYGKFRVGNVEVFLLDTRSQRDAHDPANPRKKGLSMIGAAQKKWLLESMRQSDADFFFLASSVNFTVPHIGSPGGGNALVDGKDDAWTAFVEEREELVAAWDAIGKPVLVMTGDLHNSFAVKVSDTVWEFASGPLGSQNHPARSEGGRPANGPFESRGRQVDIRWSSYMRDEVPASMRKNVYYAVAQVNNVFSNPKVPGTQRWVAFPRPHLVIQYFDGNTGEMVYAEAIHPKTPKK